MNDLLKYAVPFGAAGTASGEKVGDAAANIVNFEFAVDPQIQDSVATLVQAAAFPIMAAVGILLAIGFHWLMSIDLNKDGKPDFTPPADDPKTGEPGTPDKTPA